MWNVFVIDSEECIKVNSEPYDAEQVAELLEELEEDGHDVLLKPAVMAA